MVWQQQIGHQLRQGACSQSPEDRIFSHAQHVVRVLLR
jgi:hypothetical protein